MTDLIDVPPGLKGVVVAETSVGDVRGTEGFFHYRQYDAVELAERRSFEDVWALLVDGALPADAEAAAAFRREVTALRALPDHVSALLPAIATAAAGEDLLGPLAAVVAILGASEGMRPVLDLTPAEQRRDCLRIAAIAPVVLCALHRLRTGAEPIAPGDGPLAYEYLRMATGAEPDDEAVHALEQYLILTIDHGLNASTFTARVIASTGASVAAAVSGALGALSGPLHGGAPSRALAALDEIGEPSNTRAWVEARLAAGGKMMGFGHAVYRTTDPRSMLLRSLATKLGGDHVERALDVEERVHEALAELKPTMALVTNVEFYAGIVMERCGLPPSMFTPTFAASRTVGWTANILEQAAAGKILRPAARYVGPPPPQPVPLP